MSNFASGFIRQSHGVASGKNKDSRFPLGTLAMQIPFFIAQGFEGENFFRGTLNVSLSGHSYHLEKPHFYFPQIRWCTELPPENFSFFECTILVAFKGVEYKSFIYWPHPSTKPEFHQDPSVLEILAPQISGIKYGDEVNVFADPERVRFVPFKKEEELS